MGRINWPWVRDWCVTLSFVSRDPLRAPRVEYELVGAPQTLTKGSLSPVGPQMRSRVVQPREDVGTDLTMGRDDLDLSPVALARRVREFQREAQARILRFMAEQGIADHAEG